MRFMWCQLPSELRQLQQEPLLDSPVMPISTSSTSIFKNTLDRLLEITIILEGTHEHIDYLLC